MTAPIDPNTVEIVEQKVQTNATRLNVAIAGSGPALLLMHGFPHTWRVWEELIPSLALSHRVIAPDLRGLGDSDLADSGYDATTLADDMRGLLDALGEPSAAVMAIDAGAPPAFLLALEHPDRVSRLVLMESAIGLLPGAEDFFRGGPPWWFGFHTVPGLAETVLAGHEAEYVDFFLRTGTADGAGISPRSRDAFVAAYSKPGALRRAFEYYRAMPENATQITQRTKEVRLTMPTLAIGGQVVGEATARQLRPITDDLKEHVIASSGHIIPLDKPAELIAIVEPFLS